MSDNLRLGLPDPVLEEMTSVNFWFFPNFRLFSRKFVELSSEIRRRFSKMPKDSREKCFPSNNFSRNG